ncbi:glycosyltransferase, partial [Candidatus Woesearchaeota archaeon]
MGLKVLYVITGLERGGAENALLRLLKKIDRKKYSPAIASLVGGDLEAEFRKLAKVTILNAKKITDALRAVKKIRTIIKNEKIDIVHSYLYHANIIARLAAVGTKAKVISSIRIKEIKKRSHNCADRLTQRLVTHYTAVSESVKKFMIAYGIPESKITTIPNGIDLEEFKIKISKTEKRKSLGIPERAPIIISVANLRKTKDYPTLFEALAQVRKKHKAELLVVGRGEAEKEYRKKAEQEGVMSATRFLGYRPDVKELIAISDV